MEKWEVNPKTNRTKHGQRRHHILAIAGQIVAAEGLEGLKLPVVAREVGISTPALYRHFDSKEALVAELALRVMDEIDEALSVVEDEGDSGDFERLARFSGAYLELALMDPVTTVLLSTFVTDPRRLVTGPLSDEIWELAMRWWKMLERTLNYCGVSSELIPDICWGLWTSLQGQLGAQKFAERRGDISVRRSAEFATFGIVSCFVESNAGGDLLHWGKAFKDGATRLDEAQGGKKKWWEID